MKNAVQIDGAYVVRIEFNERIDVSIRLRDGSWTIVDEFLFKDYADAFAFALGLAEVQVPEAISSTPAYHTGMWWREGQ